MRTQVLFAIPPAFRCRFRMQTNVLIHNGLGPTCDDQQFFQPTAPGPEWLEPTLLEPEWFEPTLLEPESPEPKLLELEANMA